MSCILWTKEASVALQLENIRHQPLYRRSATMSYYHTLPGVETLG
jgi:hypothetical protein